ncbi:hypothetical protein Nmel_001390 [Mimus melanotis]
MLTCFNLPVPLSVAAYLLSSNSSS